MRAVTWPNDEPELRTRASSNARELVDKLQRQVAELEDNPRFTQGADLARVAADAARQVLRLLAEPAQPSDRDPV